VPYQMAFDPMPKTLLGRVLTGLAAVAVIILAVFFLTIALAVAGIVLAVAAVRVMWLLHKARKQAPPRADNEPIEVEYTVVSETELPDRRERKP
jgi:hypothetical protein